jgi:hypothetical protein
MKLIKIIFLGEEKNFFRRRGKFFFHENKKSKFFTGERKIKFFGVLYLRD